MQVKPIQRKMTAIPIIVGAFGIIPQNHETRLDELDIIDREREGEESEKNIIS